MRRWLPLLIYFCFILVFLSPNIDGFWGGHGQTPWPHQGNASTRLLDLIYIADLLTGFCLLLFVTVQAVAKPIFSFVCAFTLSSLALIETASRLMFGAPTEANFWRLTVSSSADEIKSYIFGYLIWIITGLIFCGLVSIVFTWANRRIKVGPGSLRAMTYLFVVFSGFFLLTSQVSPSADGSIFEPQTSEGYACAEVIFPFNVAYAWYVVHVENQRIAHMREQRLVNQTSIVKKFDGPDIVVLVIGESSTASHWSLSRYRRMTNPHLERRNDIVYFPFAFSLAAYTRASVPMLLRLFTSDSLSSTYQDRTLLNAYNSLGYQTHWYSLQPSGGAHDDLVHVYSQDAGDQDFLAGSNAHASDAYDELLLKRLPDLKKIKGRHFFVLHTMGSHVAYHHRYPPSFAGFKPTLPQSDWGKLFSEDPADQEKVINAYDNSILYTDFILDSLIQQISESGHQGLVAYVSDHGQGLREDGCKQMGHSYSCPSAYHVPMLFWATRKWRQQHNDQWRQLRDNIENPTSSLSFAMTVLSLSGATYEHRLDAYVLSEKSNLGLPVHAVDNESRVFDLLGGGH